MKLGLCLIGATTSTLAATTSVVQPPPANSTLEMENELMQELEP